MILVLNLALGERGLGSAEAVRQASAWQQAARGVTYSPPVTHTRAFKAHRLADRVPEINTIVLGASSLMGITEAMFPAPMRTYNFTLTANPTSAIAAEAEFIDRHHATRIRTILIGLDWAIGMIYHAGGVPAMDLTPAATLVNYGAGTIPLHRKFADALSSPKVINLGNALRAAMKSGQPVASFKHTFSDLAGAEYRCADGSLARDYDVVNRGICLGFRYDGSWTFAGERHLSEARAQTLARAAAAPSSKFSKYLCETQGEPNPEFLRRLGVFAQRFVSQGGDVAFILPPLIPGMEQAMLTADASNRCLARTKTVLDVWARQHGVTVIDAAASEHFGCKAEEFLDENHAWPECHARILSRYWSDRKQQRVAAGLYRPGL
ncbi:MAG: hypothetical protein ABL891_06180 [Burkholderiales bacterium]